MLLSPCATDLQVQQRCMTYWYEERLLLPSCNTNGCSLTHKHPVCHAAGHSS